MKNNGFQASMPSLLDTIRWIVEAVNGRIKNKNEYLPQVIRNSNIPTLMDDF